MRILSSLALYIATWIAVPSARADVLPDFEEPDCEPGYVVSYGHEGVHCVRPSCSRDSDCPPDLGLVCPPGHCFRYVEDRECLEREGLGQRDRDLPSRNAFEPPPPCPPLQERAGPATCQTASDCGEGLNCSPRTCQPGPNAMSGMSRMSSMSSTSMSEASAMNRPATSTDDDAGGCAVGGSSAGALFVFVLWALRSRRSR